MRLSAPTAGVSLAIISAMVFLRGNPARADDGYVPFDGAKSTWHEGFERFDYVMDEATLAISGLPAPEGEKTGVRDPEKGQRRCVIVAPKVPAPGNPWSWQGCYWNHEPQTEVELLRRGFHIAYISANAALKPGKEWDAWYDFLTVKHGLSKKPAFIGMSRGGQYAYTWATSHPDQVSCIYADNPGANGEIISKLGSLASNDVPLFHVCGSIDPLLGRFSNVIEGIYQQLGGRISVMIKDGAGHHPHSLRDPKLLADFITQSVQPVKWVAPAFLGGKARMDRTTSSAFYSIENLYRDFPREGTYITCRGAWFSKCYTRYSFEIEGVEGTTSVIVPEKAAPGTPWIFRAGLVERDAWVDLALLADGFHIVTGPVPYNADGPKVAHWNTVYEHLTAHGFSKMPVMQGEGRAAGEVYAWAIENPDKVACIYAENPVLRSYTSKARLLDNLAPLAKAGVPLLHFCGSLDPAFDDQTKAAEDRYKALGGTMKVIVTEGQGHYPLGPKDAKPVVDYIAEKTRNAGR